MSEHPPPADGDTLDRRWKLAALGIAFAVLILSSLLGFLIMPVVQGQQINLSAFAAICRAVGINPGTPAMRQPTSSAEAQPVSRVAWDPPILQTLASGDRMRGAQLAGEVCSACHGEEGVSPSPDFPHLAGQSAAAIYKQLHDYKSGARVHPQMTPVAERLTDQQLADIAAYYARGNVSISLGHRSLYAEEPIARLVAVGDPSRGIPSCNACHGSGVGGPTETPTLVGQHAEYLQRQMQLYANGERTNDVYARMRSIAARLSPAEMAALAAYYQGTR